jgi:hypothetical protein
VIVHGTASQDLKHKQPGSWIFIQLPALFLCMYPGRRSGIFKGFAGDMASGRQNNDHCRALIVL